MRRPFLSAPGIALTAGERDSQPPSSDEPPQPASPLTPGRAVRIRNRVLWALAGMALAVLLSYAGFVIWIRTTSNDAIARAQRLLSRGQPAAARRSLDWLLWSDPNHPDALMMLGACLQAEQDIDAAAKAFGRVPVDSSRHDEALLLQAVAYLHLARCEEAEEILVKHLAEYPTHQENPYAKAAYEELKWLYFNQFRGRELEEFLNASLSRDPGNFQLLIDLLNTEFRRQVAQEGIGPLKKANEMKPGQPSVLLALGYCNWKLGDVETAWRQIQAAIEFRPEHLETRLLAAEFLLEQGQLDSAESLLTPRGGESSSLKAEFDKDDRWWWVGSRLAHLRGEEELALEYLDKALALRAFELKYVHRRGMLLQALGRTEEAAKALAEARQLELCESRLNEIVRGGDLEYPTPDVCLEVADLCEKRGRQLQADGWRYGAEQLRRQAAMQGGAFPAVAGER